MRTLSRALDATARAAASPFSTTSRPVVHKVQGVKKGPAPAKPVERLWFVGTRVPVEAWPRRFGEDPFDEDVAADLAVRSLKGDQVYVFHDDRPSNKAGSALGPAIFAFASKYQNHFRIYENVHDVEAVERDARHQDTPRLDCTIDNGDVFFVCGHGNRDVRCGEKGKEVLQAFRKLGRRAFACSHVGGHAFAGNVVNLPSAAWYSFVDGSNVQEILQNQCTSVFFRGKSW